MNRKFVTVLMAACLIVTLFAGCGSKDQDALSTGPDVGASSTQEPGTAAGADAAIPGESQNADGQGGDAAGTIAKGGGGQTTTTKKSSSASSTTTKKNSGGNASGTTKPNGGSSNTTTKPNGGGSSEKESKAEIVSYFNTAANKGKTGKPGLNYNLSFSLNVLGQSFSDGDNDTIGKGSNLNDAFPVSGKSWASQLPASTVKSATRTLNNGRYTIKIALNTEKDVTNIAGSAHGKVFTTMDLNDINDAVQDGDMQIKNVSNTFHDSSITCVIDAKSGNMLSAAYSLNNDISATIASEGFEIPATIKMKMNTSYTMNW